MSDVGRLVRERGLVVLSQVTATEFLDTMSQLGPTYTHPDGEADGTTLITPSERPGELGRGFTMEALPVHTDRSSLADPPRFLGMRLVRHGAHMGGTPMFADLDLASVGLPKDAIASLSIESISSGHRLPFQVGPHGLRYRDDTHGRLVGPHDLVAEIRRRTARVTLPVDWLSSGDAYIIDNHRIAHGRTAITHPARTSVRVLAYSPEQKRKT
ncbi:TauD/TfdA family dioxygenase [Promicromonospora sp. NPDC019610]|uniref:TauD/TfdA family dioxygenase n=1 Tax=Promicromonospora sp. NPDC019610 TaxID=3364405 RepID=UPI0037BAF512